MRIPLPAARRRARIEIIPLIDIVFFLLATFVMVSLSMVKNQGIAVNLPKASTAASRETPATVTLTVTEDGTLYWNKERLDRAEVSKRLKRTAKTDPDVSIVLNGDEQASFGSAVSVLDEARKAGLKKVSIQTKPSGETR